MDVLQPQTWAPPAWAALPSAPLPSAPLPTPDMDSGSDAEAALLPRGTVVLVRGNARTRQSLIGQRAVVRRAVGLGGWHWLVLPSGEEVKLQRNALEVLERPSGNEQQDMSEEEEEERRREQQQQQASAPRGYAYEPAEPHAEDRPRPPRRPPSVPPAGPHAFHDDFGRTRLAAHSHSRGGPGGSRINLNKLQTAALKRYGTVYHLPAAEQAAITREQLLDAVEEHFAAQQVEENEVIACFLNAVRRHRMGLPR